MAESLRSWFAGRTLAIATMHHKEKAIAPLLTERLGVEVMIPQGFNTDQFGTFTRDIKRRGTQIETARQKIEAVLQLTGADLAIASEGSFCPHPSLPWITCDREILVLRDQTHNLEFVGQVISEKVNHQYQTVRDWPSVLAFAEQVGFPKQGLVMMATPHSTDSQAIFKGITQESALKNAFETLMARSTTGEIHLETDLRALFNPTRMQVIAETTQALIQILEKSCPQCACPGFSVTRQQPGLPCGWCSTPTSLILFELYECQRCQFSEERYFPQQMQVADPAYCGFCNP